MKKLSFVVIVLTLLTLSGCSEEKTASIAKRYVVKEATHQAVQYVKATENKDVLFTTHEFDQENGKSLIILNGYDVKDPEKKREITIDYNQDFKIVNQ